MLRENQPPPIIDEFAEVLLREPGFAHGAALLFEEVRRECAGMRWRGRRDAPNLRREPRLRRRNRACRTGVLMSHKSPSPTASMGRSDL